MHVLPRIFASGILGAIVLCFVSLAGAAPVQISASTTVTPAQASLYTNDDVTVTGAGTVLTLMPHGTYGTLVEYAFNSLVVSNNAAVLGRSQTNGPTYDANAKGVAIVAAGDVNVMSGCVITAVGQGFYNKGPGYGICTSDAGGGAGHGGSGGDARFGSDTVSIGIGGPAYGSVLQPTSLGSGGGQTFGSGAIKITAGGTVTVDGLIDVKGPTNTLTGYYNNSVGSGGSIWIRAGSLAGAGAIRADGGSYATTQGRFHGGGGGGRIAVYMTTDNFAGTMTAYGGNPLLDGGYMTEGYGAAGTVYKKLAAQANGVLIVNNNGNTKTGWGANATYLGGTNDAATYTFDGIVLTNGGVLSVNGAETLNVGQDTIQTDGSGKLCWTMGRGTLALPSAYVVSNMTLVLNNGTPAGLTSLNILSNSWLTHFRNSSTDVYRIDLTLDSLTVQAGGGILVSSNGYLHEFGPGKGGTSLSYYHGGAGHGGRGGFSVSGSPGGAFYEGGAPYGSVLYPTNCGSAGHGLGGSGDATRSHWENQGGGAVKLTINGTLTVDGLIAADAGIARYIYTSSGAGGSIWITAQTLAGAGLISARGADGSVGVYNGRGGGGRIALYLATNSFTGVVRADGGQGNEQSADRGGAGTIFMKSPGQTYGELKVDNTNKTTFAASAMLGPTNDTGTYTFDKLTLIGKGRLEIAPGQTVQVLGSPYPNIAGDTNNLGILVNNGTFLLPSSCTISNIVLANNNGASLGSLQNLTLTNNSVLTHSRNWSSEQYRMDLSVANLSVGPSAKVAADGFGYAAWWGPGAPGNRLQQPTPSVTNATHGGWGWGSTNAPYGNPYCPTNLGSGGDGYWGQGLGAEWPNNYVTIPYGGGAIKLRVSGALTVYGTISADAPYSAFYSGAGSGGSVYLDVGTLAGTGTIRANGINCGSYNASSGGSGGGRIGIRYKRATFANFPLPGLYTGRQDVSTSILVKGGHNTSANGPEDGSIYIEKVTQGSLFVIQ